MAGSPSVTSTSSLSTWYKRVAINVCWIIELGPGSSFPNEKKSHKHNHEASYLPSKAVGNARSFFTILGLFLKQKAKEGVTDL